jgi:hypothetical protein
MEPNSNLVNSGGRGIGRQNNWTKEEEDKVVQLFEARAETESHLFLEEKSSAQVVFENISTLMINAGYKSTPNRIMSRWYQKLRQYPQFITSYLEFLVPHKDYRRLCKFMDVTIKQDDTDSVGPTPPAGPPVLKLPAGWDAGMLEKMKYEIETHLSIPMERQVIGCNLWVIISSRMVGFHRYSKSTEECHAFWRWYLENQAAAQKLQDEFRLEAVKKLEVARELHLAQ